MRRIALALLPIAILAACASAQKTADQAAATGDWKTAEANYAAVLRDDPSNAEKRARWRPATVGQASRIAGISPADVTLLLVHLKRLG